MVVITEQQSPQIKRENKTETQFWGGYTWLVVMKSILNLNKVEGNRTKTGDPIPWEARVVSTI